MSTKPDYQFLKELNPEGTTWISLIQDLSSINNSLLPKFYAWKSEKASSTSNKLKHEHKVLMECEGEGVPKIEWAGTIDDKNMIVMELLGNNLQYYHNQWNNKFSLKTTLILFDHILGRISSIHNKGYLHRNIKPENFMMGLNDK